MQQNISKLTTKALASIYYDINYVCILRSTARWEPSANNVANYRFQFSESAPFLDRAVAHALDPTHSTYQADPSELLHRLKLFVDELGWKMLLICALAEGFRRACREFIHTVLWRELVSKIKENQWSLEVFARSRVLDWRGQLLKYASLGIPKINTELRPARSMSEQHPHHIVQTMNKKIQRPWHDGSPQIHINEPVMDPQKWDSDSDSDSDTRIRPTDPTIRKPNDGRCKLCRSPNLCACTLDFSAGSLVELVERPGTGTGVRALTFFKEGDILGQFIGEICPPDWNGDLIYSLAHPAQTKPYGILAVISPCKFGNWTRFIAHSCNASTDFASRTIGNRTVTTVEAARDIAAFEDVTVNYGHGYWEGRECMCGEENCCSRREDSW
ncbi:hypothetical protein BDW59DRAFT_181080 [Aspergillus cavernicola]|uniref:SET domain-containing protein n=1 Tax=Aspergillus cavernicola TaxID=176166 RepID=A0ABR4I358_9EURO